VLLLRIQNIALKKWEELAATSQYSSVFPNSRFLPVNVIMFRDFSTEVFAIEKEQFDSGLMCCYIAKELGLKGYFSKRGNYLWRPGFY